MISIKYRFKFTAYCLTILQKEIQRFKRTLKNVLLEHLQSLPKKKKSLTVLRSPFVNKSSRDQFETLLYFKSVSLCFKNFISEYLLLYFEKKMQISHKCNLIITKIMRVKDVKISALKVFFFRKYLFQGCGS